MAETRGFIVAATASGSGKTVVTLGILKALSDLGYRLSSAKAGPDFIDPKFHERIIKRSCLTLDSWAMRPVVLSSLLSELGKNSDVCVVEGVMGLFDGASNGMGSTAQLAKELGFPVILILDVRRQAQSAAAILKGFHSYDPECIIRGVILNGVASDRHENLLRQAIEPLAIPILGTLKTQTELELPSRHLGLVQASEHKDFKTFADTAGSLIAENINLDYLIKLAEPFEGSNHIEISKAGLSPLGQVVAVAQDAAFEFSYPHILRKWQACGTEIIPFSPLADNSPSPRADAIYLPGGYPELYAGQISEKKIFLDGLRKSADNNCLIYGECGGYMVLGEFLENKNGEQFEMAGLLPVSTSFFSPKRHLGYRRLRHDSPLPWTHHLRGHEFHYASIIDGTADTNHNKSTALFDAEDVEGNSIGKMGHRLGRVMGSFAHIIDQESFSSSNQTKICSGSGQTFLCDKLDFDPEKGELGR